MVAIFSRGSRIHWRGLAMSHDGLHRAASPAPHRKSVFLTELVVIIVIVFVINEQAMVEVVRAVVTPPSVSGRVFMVSVGVAMVLVGAVCGCGLERDKLGLKSARRVQLRA